MKLSELVLSATSNEATAFPYWFITIPGNGHQRILAGIWFNREDAERYLQAASHNFPKNAFVYAGSGWHSWHLKELYAMARLEPTPAVVTNEGEK